MLLVFVTACSQTAPTGGILRACLGANDAPRSQLGDRHAARRPKVEDRHEDRTSRAAGFDVEVANLIANELDRSLEIEWMSPEVPTEIESSDIDLGALLSGRCDIQLSIPGADALGEVADSLVLSVPYYGTSFELVPEDAPFDWQVLDTMRIAVRANAVAHSFVDARGITWTMRRDEADIIRAIMEGEAEAGLIWGPGLALLDIQPNPRFEPPQALRWNQHIALRRSDGKMLSAINAILERDDVAQRIQRMQTDHNLPARRPFTSVHGSS